MFHSLVYKQNSIANDWVSCSSSWLFNIQVRPCLVEQKKEKKIIVTDS